MLRRRRKARDDSYKTWIFNPLMFCVFSAFLIIRGIITDPMQGLTIFVLTVIGWAVFKRVSARELV